MSTPFQNRLVGTIIVAAATIIFLPDLLDGEKQSYKSDFEAIPQTPKFTSIEEKKEFPQDKLAKLPTEAISDEKAIDDDTQSLELGNKVSNDVVKVEVLSKNKPIVEKKLNEKAKVTSSSTNSTAINTPVISKPEKAVIEKAWVIHLGSFKHKQNVKELLAKLKRNGYTAFTKPIKTKNGTLTKVFVGPELIKSSLDKKIPKLKKLTNVQGKVARFTPTK